MAVLAAKQRPDLERGNKSAYLAYVSRRYRSAFTNHVCNSRLCEYVNVPWAYDLQDLPLPEVLRWAALVEPDGTHKVPGSLCLGLARWDMSLEKAVRFAEVVDDDGFSLFPAVDWPSLSRACEPVEAARIGRMESCDGLRVSQCMNSRFPYRVDGGDIYHYLRESKRSVDDMVEVAGRLRHDCAIFSIKMGLSPGEAIYTDTGRPKAVVVLPPFHTFSAGVDLLRGFLQTYDTQLVFAHRKREVLTALDAVADVSLLVVAALSTQRDINIYRLSHNPAIGGAESHLTPNDTEFREHLGCLAPGARILLCCCETGKGKHNALNMANCFRDWSGGKQVTAPRAVFSDMTVRTLYPCDVRFINKSGRDVTYMAQP